MWEPVIQKKPEENELSLLGQMEVHWSFRWFQFLNRLADVRPHWEPISWLKQQSLLDFSISRATNSTYIKTEYRITRKNIGFLLFTTAQASEILGTGRDTEPCFVSSFVGNYGFYSSWIYNYLKIKCNLLSEVIMFKNTICVLKIWAMLSFIEEHGLQMKWGELIKKILL